MIGKGASLVDVALLVGATLQRAGIRAVLTGGACVAVHTRGTSVSKDIDYVIQSAPTQRALDEAMASLGFVRHGDRYISEVVDFYVEFPPGPLAVGAASVNPIEISSPAGSLLALSATDICKDRLAAFLHWGDKQSLELAVQIARLNKVDLSDIRRWSRSEGAAEQLDEFLKRIEGPSR